MRHFALFASLLSVLLFGVACSAAPAPQGSQEPAVVTATPDAQIATGVAGASGTENTICDEDTCVGVPSADSTCPNQGSCANQGACPNQGACTNQDSCVNQGSCAQTGTINTDKSCPAAQGDACALANGLAPAEPPCGCEEDAPSAQYHKLTAKQAKENMDSDLPYILLDVRTKEEYDAEHIPGAILLPNEDISSKAPAALPDKNANILLYCRSGRRSKEAADKLVALGYTEVYDFGGIIDWPYSTTKDA